METINVGPEQLLYKIGLLSVQVDAWETRASELQAEVEELRARPTDADLAAAHKERDEWREEALRLRAECPLHGGHPLTQTDLDAQRAILKDLAQ